jgi:hypothetical protein
LPILTRHPGDDRPRLGRSAPGIHIRPQEGPLEEGIQGLEPTPPCRRPPQRTSSRGILIAPDTGIRHGAPLSGRCLPAPSDLRAHSLSAGGAMREPRKIVIQDTGAREARGPLVAGRRFGRARFPDLPQTHGPLVSVPGTAVGSRGGARSPSDSACHGRCHPNPAVDRRGIIYDRFAIDASFNLLFVDSTRI